jgi:SAM-dependent methyltransferase
LPVDDATFDAIINTQVLEHVPEPASVLAELHRVLKPAGRLFITAPFVWYLHEEPYDYYRYTSHGLRHLLVSAGFGEIDIKPMSNSFATLAQLVAHLGYMAGRAPDGLDLQRDIVYGALESISGILRSFESVDARWILPLSYSATAAKSDEPRLRQRPTAPGPGEMAEATRDELAVLRAALARAEMRAEKAESELAALAAPSGCIQDESTEHRLPEAIQTVSGRWRASDDPRHRFRPST